MTERFLTESNGNVFSVQCPVFPPWPATAGRQDQPWLAVFTLKLIIEDWLLIIVQFVSCAPTSRSENMRMAKIVKDMMNMTT